MNEGEENVGSRLSIFMDQGGGGVISFSVLVLCSLLKLSVTGGCWLLSCWFVSLSFSFSLAGGGVGFCLFLLVVGVWLFPVFVGAVC